MSKTLFLSPPGFDGFDGGAGARYQTAARSPAIGIPLGWPNPPRSCPVRCLIVRRTNRHGGMLRVAKDFDHVIIHTPRRR